ncbi:WH1 domain containing protein [Acanthamoeba castellanii str. Neff]|uniref:WH1 domain containing protein n=1 Tax=Acanthamoeba castellanii (strain ATCC 30010 / Neff) TaxID=1257118 RepID=L8HIL7_ACACF|nr:WH1 domain containing protein [Acanthamoeba castellanii str. Neff]ELR25045.1 WH1 domain containing protein [Acanthamoeba castellanii str. Neff]
MGGNTLNEGESQMVYSSAGGQVKSTAVARLYMSQGNTWAYSHLWGAAALVAVDGDAGAHYIRLVDLQSGQVTWEQELYDRFEYQSATPFFHTFEGNDAVIGLSFADESDAATFHHAVASFGSAAGAMSFGSSLADQLASAQLKSAEDRSVPDLAGLNEEQSSTLADTLAKAMAARRVDMRADEDELDSDDEWSD